jgi:hypothetical protein
VVDDADEAGGRRNVGRESEVAHAILGVEVSPERDLSFDAVGAGEKELVGAGFASYAIVVVAGVRETPFVVACRSLARLIASVAEAFLWVPGLFKPWGQL